MTATTKFYAGFFFALALVIALAFALGYAAGSRSHPARAPHRPAAVATASP